MNLKEGTRRFALLLGAAGAILGGFASYMELQTVLSQRARHNRFEKLANSDVVKQARTDWVSARIPPDYDALAKSLGGTTTVPLFDPQGRVRDVPSGDVSKALASGGERAIRFKAPDGKERWVRESERDAAVRSGGVPDAPDFSDQQKLLATAWRSFGQERRDELLARMNSEQKSRLQTLIDRQVQQGQGWEIEDPDGKVVASVVDKDGITTIHWTRDFGVESVETQDGQTLYSTPAPSAWTYLLVVLFPMLGFFIPWGAIRAIGWVGAGFTASS
ncbi:MAG: hypothetical protein ABR976_20915 [Terracidiphilus sp.]|jgi:hypothetical protein